MSCRFCEIVAGKAASRIYQNEDYLAILDIRPFTRGHTLVFPKRHTVDLTDTPPDTCAETLGIGQRIARAARASSLNANGNNVVISDGRRGRAARSVWLSRCMRRACSPGRSSHQWADDARIEYLRQAGITVDDLVRNNLGPVLLQDRIGSGTRKAV